MRVRVMLDVWLRVDAENASVARHLVESISDASELDIEDLHAVGQVLEVENDEENPQ
jgi:hypothetical protein